MFCSKCGKTIDDNATFCNFCGSPVTNAAAPAANDAPVAPQVVSQPAAPQSAPQQYTAPQQSAPQYGAPQQGAPQYGAPQQGAPQYGAPQQSAPQYGAPQQGAPQYGAPQQGVPQYGAPQQGYPQYGAPQGQYGYPSQPGPTLSPYAINIINKILKGTLAVLGLLVLIGAIGTLASYGAYENATTYNAQAKASEAARNFMGLARVPAIIAFSFAVIDAVFTFLTKQKSMLTYINAGIGVILFTFNFVLYGCAGEADGKAGLIVSCVFLLVGGVALLISTLITLLNKERQLFRPRNTQPPMPPMPPSYPPYQQ